MSASTEYQKWTTVLPVGHCWACRDQRTFQVPGHQQVHFFPLQISGHPWFCQTFCWPAHTYTTGTEVLWAPGQCPSDDEDLLPGHLTGSPVMAEPLVNVPLTMRTYCQVTWLGAQWWLSPWSMSPDDEDLLSGHLTGSPVMAEPLVNVPLTMRTYCQVIWLGAQWWLSPWSMSPWRWGPTARSPDWEPSDGWAPGQCPLTMRTYCQVTWLGAQWWLSPWSMSPWRWGPIARSSDWEPSDGWAPGQCPSDNEDLLPGHLTGSPVMDAHNRMEYRKISPMVLASGAPFTNMD